MNGIRLPELAWDLEETGTDFCVAPAPLGVAGGRRRHHDPSRSLDYPCRRSRNPVSLEASTPSPRWPWSCFAPLFAMIAIAIGIDIDLADM